jgi:hypothetical protein
MRSVLEFTMFKFSFLELPKEEVSVSVCVLFSIKTERDDRHVSSSLHDGITCGIAYGEKDG